MSVPRKAGGIQCWVCKFDCTKELYMLTHRFTGESSDATLHFCSRECLMEHFEDELFHDKLDRALKKEFATLHKQVCPACARRLARLR